MYKNVRVVVKENPKIYRGPRPDSFRDLYEMGVKVAINLESGIFELLSRTRYEFECGYDFGITETDFPMSNWSKPDVERTLSILRFMDLCRKKELPIYLHCRWGKDRTGFLVAAYRIQSCGWTYEEAIDEMFVNGFRKWAYWYWLPVLKEIELKKSKG